MSVIDVAYAFTAPVEAVMFFMMFDTFFERRRKFKLWEYVLGIIILSIMFSVVNKYFLYRLGNLMGMVVSSILVSSYYYRTTWQKKIIVPLLVWVLLAAAEILVLNIITLLFGITATEVISIPAYLVLGVIMSKVVDFAICYAIFVKRRSTQFEVGRAYWFLFLFLFLCSALATFLIYWMLYELNNPDYNFMVTICSFGLYVGTFLALYLYERSIRQNQIIHNQEQAEQQMSSQIKHMDELILKQNELRSMRHDMNAHLIALKGFFDTNDLISGQRYLSGLVDQFQGTTPAINTGNNAFDAIINAKKSLAERKGITFLAKIYIQEELIIDPRDLSVIFGNALDNAIEACERLSNDKRKQIELTFQQEEHIIVCEIINTALKKEKEIFTTSKEDKINHGFGMQNIKNALEKYNALVLFEQEENLFSFSFLIFI